MKRTITSNSALACLPDSYKYVNLRERGICWIEKVKDNWNNAFCRELSEVLLFMAKIEKSGTSYIRDILSANGTFPRQTELQK